MGEIWGVPSGKTAVARPMCPLSTRVKHSRCHAVGSPRCIVRVTSVVPMSYWPPESTSSILLLGSVGMGIAVGLRVGMGVGVRVRVKGQGQG